MSSWNIWSVPVGIISLIIISPVLAIFYSALLGDTTLWPHLFSTVLPRYLLNTLLLMLGVGSLSLLYLIHWQDKSEPLFVLLCFLCGVQSAAEVN